MDQLMERRKGGRKEGRYVRKVKLQCLIAEDVNEELRQLIQQKYKYYTRGLLGWEVEQALRAWLAMHTEAQRERLINKTNPNFAVAQVFLQVKQYLMDNYYEELIPGTTVPLKILEKAIIATRGADKRTVRKWLETFYRMGLIKPISNATWELTA
jgi:hypothetical protein